MRKEIVKIDCVGNFELYIEAEGIDKASIEVNLAVGNKSWHFDDGMMCGNTFKAKVWLDGGRCQADLANRLVKCGWVWRDRCKKTRSGTW